MDLVLVLPSLKVGPCIYKLGSGLWTGQWNGLCTGMWIEFWTLQCASITYPTSWSVAKRLCRWVMISVQSTCTLRITCPIAWLCAKNTVIIINMSSSIWLAVGLISPWCIPVLSVLHRAFRVHRSASSYTVVSLILLVYMRCCSSLA